MFSVKPMLASMKSGAANLERVIDALFMSLDEVYGLYPGGNTRLAVIRQVITARVDLQQGRLRPVPWISWLNTGYYVVSNKESTPARQHYPYSSTDYRNFSAYRLNSDKCY